MPETAAEEAAKRARERNFMVAIGCDVIFKDMKFYGGGGGVWWK